MPTFLVNEKMNPALAARIHASVRGDSHAKTESASPRQKRLLGSAARLSAVVLVGLAVHSFLSFRAHEASELSMARTSLVNDVKKHASSLSLPEKNLVERVSVKLASASAGYEGDLVSSEVRASGLTAWLARPTVYVRGPIAAFGEPKTLTEVALSTRKDPLLVCLVEPPKSRDEKAVLEKVRAVYMGGADSRTPQQSLLGDAILGLPLLTPSFEQRAAVARDVPEVRRLRRELEKAPLEAAKKAARAEVLVYAMDEPGHGNGPTEIDGERAHDVRVGVVNLVTGAVLVRLRRPVDPAWISSTARVVYASGMDGCLLALDVRASVEAPSSK